MTETTKAVDYSEPLKNAKHERFCQEYIVDNNGTQSAKNAGFSKRTAGQKAVTLLLLPTIKGRLAHLQANLSEASGVTALMLMNELKRIGFSNIDDYLRIDEDGNVIGKDFDTIDKSKLAAIESIKQTINVTSNKDGDREYETKNFTFKLHDKLKAIAEMAKHIGFYEKDNRQKTENLADFLKAFQEDD